MVQTTPASSRQARHAKAKIDKGYRRVPVWLSPDDEIALAAIRVPGTSEAQTIRNAILEVFHDMAT